MKDQPDPVEGASANRVSEAGVFPKILPDAYPLENRVMWEDWNPRMPLVRAGWYPADTRAR